jgi:hypothetical protein
VRILLASGRLNILSTHPPTTGFFINYLPIPLVLLTDSSGNQAVHIAPEAFTVASAEFPDEIDFWQNALPGQLQGQLESVRTLISRNYHSSDTLHSALWRKSYYS